MVGVGCLVIIVSMASCTGIRGVVIVAIVTAGTRIGNTCMRSFQRVIIIVDGKSGRLPRIGGMTRCTVGWNNQRAVVRVYALVVIRRMATRAICRRAGIPRSMAVEAGCCQMRSRQWKISLAMVKSIVLAPCRVTGKAGGAVIRIAVHAVVVIIRFRICMASGAGEFRIIRRILMAVEALIPFPFVFATVNREIICIVLRVFRRHPIHIRRMALDTILRKIGSLVIRNQCSFIVVFMTGDAIGWRIRIIGTGMAFGAI